VIAWCTYCSAAKREDPGLLPALERYLDRRIHDLAARATVAGMSFLILSGEYGLLRPDEPIPWYDHLLRADEVEALAARMAGQLEALGVTELVHHTVEAAIDPLIIPYRDAITLACASAGVTLRVDEIAPIDS